MPNTAFFLSERPWTAIDDPAFPARHREYRRHEEASAVAHTKSDCGQPIACTDMRPEDLSMKHRHVNTRGRLRLLAQEKMNMKTQGDEGNTRGGLAPRPWQRRLQGLQQ